MKRISDLRSLVSKYYEECNASNPPKVYLAMEIAELVAQACEKELKEKLDKLTVLSISELALIGCKYQGQILKTGEIGNFAKAVSKATLDDFKRKMEE